MLLAVKLVWVVLNTIAFIFAVKVYANANSDFDDVSQSQDATDAVKHQARSNRILAMLLTLFTALYLSVGVLSLFSTGNQALGTLVVLGLIAGVVVISWAIYRIDRARTTLRAIVGGRRKTDRIQPE